MANITIILLAVSIIISAALSIYLVRIMLKRQYRLPYLVLFGIIFLGIVAYFGYLSISGNFNLIFVDFWENGWPAILLVPASILFYGLLRKPGFEKKWKYSLNLFFGGVLFTVIEEMVIVLLGFLSPLSLSLMNKWGNNSGELLVAMLFVAMFIMPLAGAALSVALGVAGFVVDCINALKNR